MKTLGIWVIVFIVMVLSWMLMGYLFYHAIPEVRVSQSQHKHIPGLYEYSELVRKNP